MAMINVIKTMASMNYFDSSTNNLTYFEWKSVNGNACNNKIH